MPKFVFKGPVGNLKRVNWSLIDAKVEWILELKVNSSSPNSVTFEYELNFGDCIQYLFQN